MRKRNDQLFMVNAQGPVIIKLFFFHALFFTFYFNSYAQKVTAGLDRDKILLGEQVTLELKLQDANARTSFVNSWFTLPDTINHIEVIKRENIDTIEVGGLTTYIQKFTLTSFDSGKWQLPVLQISLQENASGKQTKLKADDLTLEVLPVDVTNMKEYHDIKDIIEVTVENNPAIIAAIIILTVLSAFFIWRLMVRKKKVLLPAKKPVIKGSPLEWAMEQILILQKEDLPSKNQVKLFYSKLDEIYRYYFQEQLQIPALQQTSDEMMIRLKIYLQKEEVRTPFFQLLRLVDAVKFAKYIPDESQNNNAVENAKKTIQHIDMLSQQIKTKNAY